MINDGLRGITSNPTIFDKAIAGSNSYIPRLHNFWEKVHPLLKYMNSWSSKIFKQHVK